MDFRLKLCTLLASMMVAFGLFHFSARAEEVPADIPAPASGAVEVYNPDVSARLDTMQNTLDAILAALLADESAAVSAPVTDYSGQLTEIESTLSNIETSMIQATAETAEPAVFEKAFEDYNTIETLLLVLSAFALLAFFLYFVSRFF